VRPGLSIAGRARKRGVPAAGVWALVLAACFVATPGAAEAQVYRERAAGAFYQPWRTFDAGYGRPSPRVFGLRWRPEAAYRLRRARISRAARPADRMPPGPWNRKTVAQPAPPPKGPLLIVVSLADQRLTLYDQGVPIAQAPVSTGTPSHPTPTGVFSVIQKRRWHRSNIYSGAPMPWMQRITWSGIALHGGVLPGYPASHGCIRLPYGFASWLWDTSKISARVVITRRAVAPVEIAHPRLFVRLEKPEPQPASDAKPGEAALEQVVAGTQAAPGANSPALVRTAMAESETTDWRREELGLRPAKPVMVASSPSEGSGASAVERPLPAIMTPLPAAMPLSQDKPLRQGAVSVFVSRKEARLFVRKGFEPVFDVAVTIERAHEPLGTHLFTALEAMSDGATMRWTAMSLPVERAAQRPPHKGRKGGRKAVPDIRDSADIPALPSAAEALDRIVMPKEAVERISELLTPGASLIISDQGLGPETGRQTDFIVLMR